MLSLPVRLGGLRIKNPTVSAGLEFKLSRQTTKPLTEMLMNQRQEEVDHVCLAVIALRREARGERRAAESLLALKLSQEVGSELQHSLQIAGEK